MKVVVFGAAGWVGRAILAHFSEPYEVRAFDYGPAAWQTYADVDEPWHGDIMHGDIADIDTVDRALEGVDYIIHTAVYNRGYSPNDDQPFLVNLKGLWNVLESARKHGIKRVVHLGSCMVKHPDGIFFSAAVRRPDGGLYATTKRLQEEMCRQYYEAHGLSIIVLRPCSIVDSRLGIGKSRNKLHTPGSLRHSGWVCRHDLATACRLALETKAVDFDILHTAAEPGAVEDCNVERTREVLGFEYEGNLEQFVVDPE